MKGRQVVQDLLNKIRNTHNKLLMSLLVWSVEFLYSGVGQGSGFLQSSAAHSLKTSSLLLPVSSSGPPQQDRMHVCPL